jgi:YaiO family outer membrane protein
MKAALAGIGLALLAPLAPAADDAALLPDQLSLLHEHSRLSDGLPDWQETTLRYARQLGPRRVAEATFGHVSRFDLHDTQLQAAYATPLGPKLSGTLEASASATHRVLPRYSAGAVLGYEFQPAWIAHGGFKTTRYANALVQQSRLMLERYFGDFSASGAWMPTRALGEKPQLFELRAHYYYADGSAVGLIGHLGEEATEVPGGVVLTDVNALALTGRHRLSPRWTLNYALFRAQQGDLYYRAGAALGVQHAF